MHNGGPSRGTTGRRLVPSRSGDAVRLLIGALAAALVAGLLPLAAGTAAAATAAAVPVPTVELPDQVDIIDDYQGQQLCDPTPKPGTLQLRDTLWRTYGRDLWAGISRDCNATWDRGISEHKDGRAIDWGVSVRNDSRALGDAFARWATANNGENARRAGIMYLIWDSKMWRTYGMARGWTEYSSCQSRYTSSSYDTSCHRDHMHISMTWHGAGADTSWYDGTAVLLDDCRAGDPVARDPGSPASPSVLFDPLAGQGTRQPCYLDSSIQAIRVPGPGKGVELQQRIRVTKLSVNAPAPVAIWTSAGSRVSLSPGSATPQEHVLTLGGDGTIYFQLPVGQAGLRVEGLGQVDTGRIGAGQVLEIPITGSRTGVPADAEAVSLNVTVTQPAAAGYVTVFPCAAARPTTSTLNFAAGQTVANSVIVGVGAGGKVCAYSTARTHIVADYAGYFPKGSAFTAVQPKRLRDTRGSADKPGRGTDVVVRVPDGAGAAALTITVTQPETDGWVAAYPCGAFSLSSSVNFRAGQTVPNSVIAKVGSGGTVCVRLSTATHVIVDMTGAMPDGAGYSSLSPQRLRDTRIVPGSPAAAGSDVVVAAPRGAAAVAVNLTVTGSSAGGWVLAYPCGSAVPNSSSVNFGPGQTVANGALVRVGEGGKVCVRGSTSAHVIVDVSGVFAPGTNFYRPATPVRAIDTRR